MKSGWHFSNGETIGVQNFAFFLNMLQAERTKFWGYLPGAFPDTLASVKYNNAAGTVTLHMKNSVNPPWFLENQLSLTTPMPLAWDLTAAGKKGNCASENASVAAKSCPAVYKYLTSQASNTSSYASNPLWQIVDGPFRLSKFALAERRSRLFRIGNTLGPRSPRFRRWSSMWRHPTTQSSTS